MRTSPRSARGVTLIELVVVLAVIAILAALMGLNLSRGKPRANLANASNELQGIIHAARQQALASGHDVLVMLFPSYAGSGGTVGRVVVVEDPTYKMLVTGSTPNFGTYSADTPAYPAGGQLITVYDLPAGIGFGPDAGLGTNKLAAPFDTVGVASSCSFCGTTPDVRGAIRFDERGRASFYSGNGAPQDVGSGASFSLTVTAESGSAISTVVITSGTGAVLAFNNG